MDVSKARAAIKTALAELNTVTDAEFQARRLAGLRPLTLAANALTLADQHLEKASTAGQPKAPKAAAETAAPVADKKK